jgi:acetyl esterase/lipase
MDPCSHRVPLAHLSRLTSAPIFSVRYRLAPQNPFPAALVDALTAYLSLLHPPPGSLHPPIPANKIILSGDSAGGNLALVLLQTLLTLTRISGSSTITFHGKEVPIEIPAGLAATSPWCDITRSMPSNYTNAHIDYLAPPAKPSDEPFKTIPIIPDSVWPASPPRAEIFCNSSILCHPLVSPLAAPSELWKGAPPIWISVGEEGLTDEGLIVARRLEEAGVPVVVDMFEGMPHCHGLLLLNTAVGKRFFESYAGFLTDAVSGRVKATGNVSWFGFKLKTTKEIPISEACVTSDEEVAALMRRSAEWRLKTEIEMQKEWRERAKL